MARLILNPTDSPVRYCFEREDSLAFVSGVLEPGTVPEPESGFSWFDLLPGHQVRRCGAFAGINWEPVQEPIPAPVAPAG